MADRGVFADLATKRFPLISTSAHEFHHALRHTYVGHRVLESTWPQATLSDRETLTFTHDDVVYRNTNVGEFQLTVTRW